MLDAVKNAITDSIILPTLRMICSFFDWIVYSIISWAYKILIYLANIDIFTDNQPIEDFMSRIYILLGIFMLFKLSFSIIQYIADPNSFKDENKGFGKLIKNVLVALILLVSVPTLFDMAYDLQRIIVKNNVIGEIIMGADFSTSNSKSDDTIETEIKDVQFLMYSAFTTLNTDVVEGCGDATIIGSKKMAKEETCLNNLNDILANDDDAKANNVTVYSFFKRCESSSCNEVTDDRNFSAFQVLNNIQVDGDNGKEWLVNYIPLISTIAGGYVAILLIMFCVDISVRIIKLCFLQMIAPISIVSYIDPKESMSDSKLKKWLSQCGSTYISLFIRLATIFFVMSLINIISNTIIGGVGSYSTNGYTISGVDEVAIYVFLTIGAFTFAKKVPEMIEDLFGIKSSGELHLASAGKTLGVAGLGIAGGAIGSIGATASSIAASKDQGLGAGKTAVNAFAGGLTGGARGTIGGAKSKGKGFVKGATSGVGQAARSAALRGNTKWTDRTGARIRNAMGMQSKFEGLDNKAKMHKSIAGHVDAMTDRARDQLSKKDLQYQTIAQDISKLKNSYDNEKQFTYQDANGKTITIGAGDADYKKHYQAALKSYQDQQKQMEEDYVTRGGLDGGTPDDVLALEKKTLTQEIIDNNLGNVYNVDEKSSFAEFKTVGDAAKAEHMAITSSDEYKDAKATTESVKSSTIQHKMNE